MSKVNVFESFGQPGAAVINEARLSHLASLGLDLSEKRVLEVGAGVGNLTGFWHRRGCDVVSTDGRAENVAEFRRRHPGWRVKQANLNVADSHASLGRFEIVFCYGTLYHLSHPTVALRSLAAMVTRLFLVESRVFCSDDGSPHKVREGQGIDQSIDNYGCRPARDWVRTELGRYMPFVYVPLTQPRYPEYPLIWPSKARACRAVFVASRQRLSNPLLTPGLPSRQRRM